MKSKVAKITALCVVVGLGALMAAETKFLPDETWVAGRKAEISTLMTQGKMDQAARLEAELAAAIEHFYGSGRSGGIVTPFASGGPDADAWAWVDSDGPGGPTYSWVELYGTGATKYTGDDANWGPFALPATFNYRGNNYTQIRVCSNGWITFSTYSSSSYIYSPLPNSSTPNNLVSAFGYDLNPGASYTGSDPNNGVYIATQGNRLIIEWYKVPNYGSSYSSRWYTFEIIIDCTTKDIICQYKEYGNTSYPWSYNSTAAIGCENSTGTVGLNVSYTLLKNNYAIRYYSLPRHDVGVVGASFNPSIPLSGQVTTITDTVQNFGDFAESNFPISGRIYRYVFGDGFETSFPSVGWDSLEWSGDQDAQWERLGTGGSPSRPPHSGSWQARSNCFLASSGAWARLKSPAVTIPAGPEVCNLSFWMYHESGYSTPPYETLYVEVGPSLSGPWTILSGGAYARYSPTNGWVNHSLSLASYAGQTIYFAFRAVSRYGNDITIDDVLIQGSSLIWSANETFTSTINVGQKLPRPFTATWTPSAPGNYLLVTWTNLSTDIARANDTLKLPFLVSSPATADLYVRNPLFTAASPPQPAAGQVWCGATYTPTDTIGNLGSAAATNVTVQTRMDGGLNPTIITMPTMAAGYKGAPIFGGWTASLIPNTAHVRRDTIFAAAPADPNLANNGVGANYTAVYDGQAVSIDQPGDQAWTGYTYTPTATVRNNSAAGAATFTATLTINPGGYSSTRTATNLGFGAQTPLTFDNWTTPFTAGIAYTVTLTCQTTGDVNTANNTITKTCVTYGDVGVLEPHYPTPPVGTVYAGENVFLGVILRNYTLGTSEPFDVNFQVEGDGATIVYDDFTPAEGMTPNEDREFYAATAWTPTEDDIGKTFILRATSGLPGDGDATNNTTEWEAVVVAQPGSDVKANSIDSPGTAIPGDTYTPKATVQNIGANPATFWTYCTINQTGFLRADYSDSARVENLPPDSSRQLAFSDWTVGDAGNYLFKIQTMLPGDAVPENDTTSISLTVTGIAESKEPVPTTYSLQSSKPNPFYNSTEIHYGLPVTSTVNLAIYDVTGKLVKTFANGTENPGFHSTVWNGVDNAGKRVGAGLYFIRFESAHYTATQKLILITK